MSALFSHELEKDFQDGEAIFIEGDQCRELYIIRSGEVVIRKKTERGDVELVTFKRGEFFGEMALLESQPRIASAFAKGQTKLLVVQPGGFLLKIRRDPTFAFEMLQTLSMRIRVTNDRLFQAFKGGNIEMGLFEEILRLTEAKSRTLAPTPRGSRKSVAGKTNAHKGKSEGKPD